MCNEKITDRYRALHRDKRLHCDCDMRVTLDGRRGSYRPGWQLAWSCDHRFAPIDIALAAAAILLIVLIGCCRLREKWSRRRK